MNKGIRKLHRSCRLTRLLIGLFTLAFFSGSCATKPGLSISHTPRKGDSLLESRGKSPSILLLQVRGSRDKVWYRVGEQVWPLEKEPVEIVREALEAELKGMGLPVTDDPGLASGRIEAEIRWFAPYGHSYLTAAVILSLALYGNGSADPLWRGRLQGGEHRRPPVSSLGGCNPIIEEVANKALSKAVEQLRWKPGLAEAIDRLGGADFSPLIHR